MLQKQSGKLGAVGVVQFRDRIATLMSRPAAELSDIYQNYWEACPRRERLNTDVCVALCADSQVDVLDLVCKVGQAQM